jgi:hypothetical protein
MDVGPGFQNGNGSICIVGEYHVIAGFLQFFLKKVPD